MSGVVERTGASVWQGQDDEEDSDTRQPRLVGPCSPE